MTTTLRCLLLCAPLALAGCVSTADLDAARAQEARAEAVLADALALPEDTPGRAALVADASAAESDLERVRRAYEELTRDGLLARGVDVVTDATRGDYVGGLEALLGLAMAAGTYLLSRRRSSADTVSQLAALEARRDATRAQQGIAPSSARSAELATSRVALAGQAAADLATEQALERLLAKRTTPQVPPPLAAPGSSHLAALAPAATPAGAERWSAPMFPVPPEDATRA